MGFTTPFFVFLFFPLTVACYYSAVAVEKISPVLKKCRLSDLALLAFSFVFYGWGILSDMAFFAGYILGVWLLGFLIDRAERKRATGFLAVSLILLLGVLYLFKYQSFTVSTLNSLAGREVLPVRKLLAPLGISFVTFSAISFVVDIYRGQAARGSLLDAALYLSFFPKVVSGPIVLWKDFGRQVSERTLSSDRFISGLNRIMIGFAKKLILADTFGTLCAEIREASGISILTAWGCAFFYMLQIYYDFSGYSDIAIGLSRLFGFELKENFNYPYVATSITEFWRRWHISLGTWFREYLYIPLGGSRKGKKRTLLNLGIVFFLTGLWHGAGWGYIAWGIGHGVCRIGEKCLEGSRFYERIPKAVKYLFTMLVVMLGWEVFRLEEMREILYFGAIMVGLKRFDWIKYSFSYFFTPKIWLLIAVAVLGATVLSKPGMRSLPEKLTQKKGWFIAQELGLMLLMVLAVIFMVNSTYSPFIYFRY
ncbi:MAG: MBOAT family protein [Oscillospiraceae bacterium]|nr:MBOAT family protein [Oscillospiraceae bacterium]